MPYDDPKTALDFVSQAPDATLTFDVRVVVDQIVTLTDPDLIYLFGSRARG